LLRNERSKRRGREKGREKGRGRRRKEEKNMPLVLGPLNSLVWYVPSLRYTRGLGWRMHFVTFLDFGLWSV